MDRNSTSPEARVGWVSTGNGRGTSDILWSCFSILLVCTWNCFHSNVPSIEESEACWLKWHGIPYWPERPLLKKWTRKVLWMVLVVIAPEIGVTVATGEYLSAKIAVGDEEDEAVTGEPIAEQDVGIVNSGAKAMEKDIGMSDSRAKQEKLTISHAFCANMGGFKVKIYEGGDSKRFYEGIILNYEGLKNLRQISTSLMIPSEEDIKALGHGDVFSKAFACVQSAWLVIQCIARAFAGLPITQLELATIAFVTCGILMYLLWWNKPFGLERRGLITATLPNHAESPSFENLTYKHFFHLSTRLPLSGEGVIPLALRHDRVRQRVIFSQDFGDVEEGDFTRIIQIIYRPINSLLGSSTKQTYPSVTGGMTISFFFTGILFSALHLLAWNFEFPSLPIQIAWRVFAVTATSLNFIAILATYIDSISTFWSMNMATPMSIIMGVLYALSRLGLIVLVFFCFYSMPAGVYQTVDWTKFLPHFS